MTEVDRVILWAIEGCSSDGLHIPSMSAVHLHFTTEQPFDGLPTNGIRIISSGSIDGRPIGEY